MARNLTNLYISESFQFLVQQSGSAFETGVGAAIPSINITASNAVSSSYAVTASFALNAGTTVSTSSLLTTASAAANVITFTKGDGSTFPVTIATGSAVSASYAVSASFANTATSASYSNTSTSASYSATATSSSYAINSTSASYANTATSASNALTATSASYALNATSASYTPNAVTTASVSLNTITFTKGDGSTFPITVNTGSGGGGGAAFPYTGSAIISGSLTVTGSTNFTGGDFKVTDQGRNGEFDVDAFKVKTQTGTQFTGSVSSRNGFTGSLQGTASYAISASYVDFGTSNGTAFTASTTWNYNHNLGTQLITIDTYDTNYEEIIPQTIDLINNFNAVITFPTAVAGFAVASLGNGVSSVTNNITNSINNITQSFTQSITNSYFDTSPLALASNQQLAIFSGTASYTTTINAVGTYNIHVSQSGTYLINANDLATLSASVNLYFYPEVFPTSSMAMFSVLAQTGSGTAIAYRSIVSASSAYEWWNVNTVAIGTASTNVARNATRRITSFPSTAGNPSMIYKNSQGLVQLSIPSANFGLATAIYAHTGSEGVALV